MKKFNIMVMAALVVPWQTVLSQNLDFEVQYDLSTYTLYKVSPEDIDKLHAQDTIKLLPEGMLEHVKEGFYDDGTSFSDVTLEHPVPLLEKWIQPVDHLVTTSNRLEAYVNGTLMYSEALLLDESSLIPPSSFAAFYLGTNNWELPISNTEVIQYDNAGFEVTINTGVKLVLQNDTCVLTYDKSDWSETIINLDLAGNQTKRKVTFFKPNEEGFLLYDNIVTWSIDQRTQPCFEKIIFQRYSNIERVFHNPNCAPTVENGFRSIYVQDSEYKWVSVHQIEGTNHIYIDIPDVGLPIASGTIKDMYGITVMDLIDLDLVEPFIDLGELPTGLYSIQINVPNLLPCKFLFKP